MSKHPQKALIFLGIAICAGFLLSVPAVADSGQGLMALESGELLPFSLGNLSAAVNGSEPPSVSLLLDKGNTSDAVPVLPDEGNASDVFPVLLDERNASDVVPAPTDAGLPDIVTEPTVPNGPENNATLVTPVPAVDASPDGTGSYDDERLAGLINTASIRLMRLSMEHAHALYLEDADAAAVAADDLHAFSIRLLGEVQPLQVSPEQQPVKDEFIRSLGAYSTASETLLSPTDAGGDSVSTAFRDLAIASESLEAVSRQVVEVQPAGTGVSAVSAVATPAARTPAVPAGTGPALIAPPPQRLPLQERYAYDDPSGENTVSLRAESTRTVTAYQEAPVNASTAKIEAGEGRMFLLVTAKATNVGHKGDSDFYAIETPERSAFVLEYQGSTFEPLEVPSFTSLGESFDKQTLERYESLKGYLYFDVPATFEVSEATLRANLGDAGNPTWDLGRELGEEPGDADADADADAV